MTSAELTRLLTLRDDEQREKLAYGDLAKLIRVALAADAYIEDDQLSGPVWQDSGPVWQELLDAQYALFDGE